MSSNPYFFQGIKKLVKSFALTKLVPSDIFLSIMFGKYPIEAVNRHFVPRNLVALSHIDRLAQPSHFWGHKLHISDTGIDLLIGLLIDRSTDALVGGLIGCDWHLLKKALKECMNKYLNH